MQTFTTQRIPSHVRSGRWLAALVLATLSGCATGSDERNPAIFAGGTGGSAGVFGPGGSSGGGAAASGGAVAGSGGSVAGSGGAIAGSGGEAAGSGGAVAGSGGEIAPGGTGATGGTGGEVAGSGGETGGTGGTGGDGGTAGTPPVLDADITVDPGTTYQVIDGFGAALPMWGSESGMWTTDEVHKFIGTGDGELGLSLLRTIIDPDSNRWSYAVASLKEARSYGDAVRVLASPWSPPASMKSNNSTVKGYLLPQYYGEYAAHLNSYVQYMAGQGVTIDVVSIQNEPDWSPDYDGCEWTGEQLRDFLRDNAAAISGPRLMIAESLQFTRGFTDPSLNDPVAVNNFDIVGGHLYGAEGTGKFSEYPLAEQKGKSIWMTEWLIHDADGSGSSIWGDGSNQAVWDETLDEVMRSVDRAMQINWNAFIWWWGRRFYSFIGDGEAAYGTTKGQVLKRGYAFSQYAKFVRPGYTRVGVTADGAVSDLSTTAYQGDDEIVVVMLNRSTSQYDDLVIDIPDNVTSAQAYVTSRTADRQAVTVTPAGHYAKLESIPARSLVTVVMSY